MSSAIRIFLIVFLVGIFITGYGGVCQKDKTTDSGSSVAPGLVINVATSITYNSATLNATVNPNGSFTTYFFEYGTSTAFGNATATQTIAGGVAGVAVSAGISGLQSSAIYYFRVKATNGIGTAFTQANSFMTLQSPPDMAVSPEPADGSSNIPVNQVLSWVGSTQVDFYDVYLGATSNPPYRAAVPQPDTSYAPGVLAFNNTYYWRVNARNSSGTTIGNLWSFMTKPNSPPVLVAPGNKSVDENSLISFVLSASDADGEAVSYYMIPGALVGASLDASTGVFSWTPTYAQSGIYNVIFGAASVGLLDEETIVIMVNNINQAPLLAMIDDKTTDEGTLLTFMAPATDPDSDAITYTMTSTPSATGATLNSSNGLFSWTPAYNQQGAYALKLKVTDSGGLVSPEVSVNITVNDVNGPPVLSAVGNKSVNENELLTFTLLAADPDGDTIAYSMSSTPGGAAFNALTGSFSWTPSYTQSGSYSVTFTATAGALKDDEMMTITVVNVNAAPVLAAVGNKSINEGAALTFTLTASDIDGDAISYSMTPTPTGVTLNAASGLFSWTPNYAQSGSYTVTFTATAGVLEDDEMITVTVVNVDGPPVLATIDDKTTDEGTPLTFTLTASDIDGDAISYSMTPTPTGVTLNAASGLFSWTPDYDMAGSYTVTFTATAGALRDDEMITITVSNVNRPPVMSAIPDQSTFETMPISFTVSATDPDGEALTYTAANLPFGAVFDAPSRIFSWTPSYYQSGVYSDIKIRATDAGGLFGEKSVMITVQDVLVAPDVTTNPAVNVTYKSAGLNGTINVNGLDAQVYFEWGLTPAYGQSTTPAEITSDVDYSVNLPGLDANTAYNYRVVATNSVGTTFGENVAFTTSLPPPTATTGTADNIGAFSATLQAIVNPNGLTTTAYFQWGLTTSYGNNTTAEDLGSGFVGVPVSAAINELAPNATYHFRITAGNSSGTVVGLDRSFITLPAPVVTTTEATNINTKSAALGGTVNPNGLDTTYYFEWGLTITYGNTTSVQNAGSGTGNVNAPSNASGLSDNTLYHFRLVAANAMGTSYGLDQSFTTVALPDVVTSAASNVSTFSVTLNGIVNPHGLACNVYFEWGLSASYCNSTAIQMITATNSVLVNANIGGLSASTLYDFRIVVLYNNNTDTAYGSNQNFTTSAIRWSKITGGYYNSMGIKNDGTLWAWGYNGYGQLGDGSYNTQPTPYYIGTGWKDIASGDYHTVGIMNDGTLWTWGRNDYGQLGDTSNSTRYAPVQISSSNWMAVGAGRNHTLAVKSDGTLWACGYNYKGQLGDNSNTNRNYLVQVGLTSNWLNVTGGELHSAGIRSDGTLWTWGYNSSGQLGNGSDIDSTIPVQVTLISGWASVSAGQNHTVGRRTDGSIWTWGENANGELGDTTAIDKNNPTRIGAAYNWTSIVASGLHTQAVDSNGQIYAWGINNYGQVGDGTIFTRYTPTLISGSNWLLIGAGYYHSLAVKSDGYLWAWGYNTYSQLGNGSLFNQSSPVQIGQ